MRVDLRQVSMSRGGENGIVVQALHVVLIKYVSQLRTYSSDTRKLSLKVGQLGCLMTSASYR